MFTPALVRPVRVTTSPRRAYDRPMSVTLDTKLRIASWDEQSIHEFDDGSKLTRADVTLSEGADGLESGSFHAVMYYRPDGTSSYTTVMRLTGSLQGRSGSFVLIGDGTFDGATARGRLQIVDGSATGDLVGIVGRAESDSTHVDYPFMPLSLTFELA
jgi:hypothetical protein